LLSPDTVHVVVDVWQVSEPGVDVTMYEAFGNPTAAVHDTVAAPELVAAVRAVAAPLMTGSVLTAENVASEPY
jgi:hypothetical protein